MKSFNHPATFQIILLLRTEDFKKLEQSYPDKFKEFFLDEKGNYDCDVDLYSGYLVNKDRKSENKIENDNESFTNVVMNDVFWNVNRKLHSKLLALLRTLSYFEMYVVNNENNRTEYYADDFTKGTEGNLHVSVEFNIDGKYEKSEIR